MAVVAVLVFVTGALYGTATYWIGGAALYVGLRGAGSKGSYLRARHILAFAAAPLVLGLVFVWPMRIAVYGSDLFRSGGGDDGTGNVVFEAILAAIGLWAFGLLVYGISVVERWTAVRALVAIGLVVLGLLDRHVSVPDSAREPLRAASKAASSSSGMEYVCSSPGNAPERTSAA